MATQTAHCNAVVARALVDPDFLGRLANTPGLALDEMRVPPPFRMALDHLDTDRLGLVAGYVCMVKHNHLWEELPLTRRLLRDEGLDLTVFVAYARERKASADGRGRGRPKAGDFVDFLVGRSAAAGPQDGLVADLARHELLLARLASASASAPADDSLRRSSGSQPAGPGGGRWCPRHRGLIAIQAYDHDPAEWVSRRVSQGDSARRERVFVCYSRRWEDDGIRFVRVDPATALVLGAVDGRRTVAALVEAAGLPSGSEPLVESVLASAVELELVVPQGVEGVEGSLVVEDGPVVDMMTGYFAARTSYVLHRAGVLDALRSPRPARSVADELGLDTGWLTGCLAFLARLSDVVERLDDGCFRATVPAYERFGFVLDKFVGAYGPCLDEAAPAPSRVDGGALAHAFERVANEREVHGDELPIASVLAEWEAAAHVVDLGCGPASLLVGMAARDPSFTGIGVDANPAMCAAAADAVARRGVGQQVTILEGDALTVLSTLPEETRQEATGLYGRSFFNACFGRGVEGAADVLRRLAGLYPGRLVVVDDYYGELGRWPGGEAGSGGVGGTGSGEAGSGEAGSGGVGGREHRAACMQDLVQVWSGQGVPPGDRAGWAAVYAAGGARLHGAYESDVDGFRRFVHVVELAGEET